MALGTQACALAVPKVLSPSPPTTVRSSLTHYSKTIGALLLQYLFKLTESNRAGRGGNSLPPFLAWAPHTFLVVHTRRDPALDASSGRVSGGIMVTACLISFASLFLRMERGSPLSVGSCLGALGLLFLGPQVENLLSWHFVSPAI